MFMLRAISCFFISINAFHNTYPEFMDANLWDFFSFLLCELLTSLVIGYTRQTDDRVRIADKYNLETYDFNKNFNNVFDYPEEQKDDFQAFEKLKEPLMDKEVQTN